MAAPAQQEIPVSQTSSTSALAAYVKAHSADEQDRIAAIYGWIATNIRYDTDSANVINHLPDPEAKINLAFRRRRGVCENFSAIFNDICTKAGLTTFVVNGYTKQNGTLDKTGHSWNAVCLSGEWLLCDATWDAGNRTNWQYFLRSPMEMITSHMPFDPMWQLMNYPVSHWQFYIGDVTPNRSHSFFNFRDSIAAYNRMDSLERFVAVANRIEQYGYENKLVKDNLAFNRMNIQLILEDRNKDLYNAAIIELNNATAIYNEFVSMRNSHFTPELPESKLITFFDKTDKMLANASSNLQRVESSEADYKFSMQSAREKFTTLSAHIKEQKEFLSLYLNTPKANRMSLFYKRVPANPSSRTTAVNN
jgi:transglutaminase/protease-like cytokinesis protein 3